MRLITKENYHTHHYRCDECNNEFAGIDVDLTTSADGRFWELLCPNCDDHVLTFLVEQPDFSALTPDRMESKHWDLLRALQDRIQATPELFPSPGETSLPQYIHAITEPYHDFLTQFDWMRWDRRVVITEDKELLRQLDFGTAIALLYTWYREDRFDETHLKWMVETGRMEVLLANLLSNKTM